jgi:hypothetical protein
MLPAVIPGAEPVDLPVLSDLMPSTEMPLLSSLQTSSGAAAPHSYQPQVEDDLTSSSRTLTTGSYTTGEISSSSDIIDTQSRYLELLKFFIMHNTV